MTKDSLINLAVLLTADIRQEPSLSTKRRGDNGPAAAESTVSPGGTLRCPEGSSESPSELS